jgi:hypothetical protein
VNIELRICGFIDIVTTASITLQARSQSGTVLCFELVLALTEQIFGTFSTKPYLVTSFPFHYYDCSTFSSSSYSFSFEISTFFYGAEAFSLDGFLVIFV